VVGWVQGRMEFGPRALGGRSIIGDPRSARMQTVMNLKIKYPRVFPAVCAVGAGRARGRLFRSRRGQSLHAASWRRCARASAFRSPSEQQALFGIEKLKLKRSELPAITHVDYSARVQTVHPETNPRYHALLKAFEAETGCARAGEYLVQRSRRADRVHARPTPIAASCAPRWIILVIENFLLDEDGTSRNGREDKSWMQEFELD
jgi:carbamoyltransferase